MYSQETVNSSLVILELPVSLRYRLGLEKVETIATYTQKQPSWQKASTFVVVYKRVILTMEKVAAVGQV